MKGGQKEETLGDREVKGGQKEETLEIGAPGDMRREGGEEGTEGGDREDRRRRH